jgi:transposase
MHSNVISDSIMIRKVGPRSSPEFKVECTQLVIDLDYSVQEAVQAMGVGKSTLEKWA